MNKEIQTKDLDKVSKEVSLCPYFVKTAYHNRLKMLDYRLTNPEQDVTYLSKCIEGIVESTYRDIYGSIYIPHDKRLPLHRQLEDERNFKTISSGINQFVCLPQAQRQEYLKKVTPKVEMIRKKTIDMGYFQRQRS